MPEVKPPAIEPQTKTLTDIELFAKAYFNISLTKYQLEIIDAVSKGKRMLSAYRGGRSTAMKVVNAYIAEGLNPHGRVRLPQHYLPSRPKLKGVTQAGKILALIKGPNGAYNFELARVALQYHKRIQELREDGHNIQCERQYLKNGRASNTYRYYLLEG